MIEEYRTKQIALINIAVEQAAQIVAYGLIVNLSYTNEAWRSIPEPRLGI